MPFFKGQVIHSLVLYNVLYRCTLMRRELRAPYRFFQRKKGSYSLRKPVLGTPYSIQSRVRVLSGQLGIQVHPYK